MAAISHLPSHQPILNYKRDPSHFVTGRTKAQNSHCTLRMIKGRVGVQSQTSFVLSPSPCTLHCLSQSLGRTLRYRCLLRVHVNRLGGISNHACIRTGKIMSSERDVFWGRDVLKGHDTTWLFLIGHSWLRNFDAD